MCVTFVLVLALTLTMKANKCVAESLSKERKVQ